MVVSLPRLFTVREYHRMSEVGILSATERTELLNGQIITMAAKGTAHSSATNLTKKWFEIQLLDRAIIRVQDPIAISEDSEPEPDVAIVAIDPLAYSLRHPQPQDVWLLIEVADSSLKYDLETKGLLYAQAEILEYWVLDVADRQLHVFQKPEPTGYLFYQILTDSQSLQPLAFPDCTVTVSDLLPPIAS